MPAVVYSVCATFPVEELAREYVAWLTEGQPSHVAQVLTGGASEGTVWREVGAAGRRRILARYVFPSRESFDRYVREFAPSLRAEGLARFGPDKGVSMERSVSEVMG
jgi:hypothetical protein